MIATSPGTPPPPTEKGEEEGDDRGGETVEVGNFTRFIGLEVLEVMDGVEELLTICVTGLEGLGFNVTLCPLLEVIIAGTPVTLIFNIVTGWEDVDGLLVVVDAVVAASVTFVVILVTGARVVVVELVVIGSELTVMFLIGGLLADFLIPQHIPKRKPSAQVPNLLPSDRIHSQANIQVPSSPIEFLHGFDLILRPAMP